MAGEDLVAKVKTDLQFLQDSFWNDRILGVLLYGSHVHGEASHRSDIDLCIVAPEVPGPDRAMLWREFISHLRDDRYDVRIFELLPLHIKMAVIEEGIVVHSKDTLELYEYFYPFRRDWDDQKHRQTISREEMISMISAPKRDIASSRSRGS